MSPHSNLGNGFETALRRVEQAWSETQAHWDDQKAAIFDSHYWSIVDNEAGAFLQVLDELTTLVENSKRTIRS